MTLAEQIAQDDRCIECGCGFRLYDEDDESYTSVDRTVCASCDLPMCGVCARKNPKCWNCQKIAAYQAKYPDHTHRMLAMMRDEAAEKLAHDECQAKDCRRRESQYRQMAEVAEADAANNRMCVERFDASIHRHLAATGSPPGAVLDVVA